ncbi:MAG: hypothetical protein NTY15_16200 [Planctomycetota bacterium]|nr:hypothetical protein [Planctomycetota bacterium]
MQSDWLWKQETTQATPDRVLPVWTDSVLHQTNQSGIRGFGGRIYFYGKENTDPVEVDGSLAVYVFDADDANPSSQKPLRKFMFTADQFQTHMSKTSIGPSYSVWLPWGEVGGPPMRLSLIARFEGRQGGTTISDPTIKMLPGVPVEKEVTKSDANSLKSNASQVSLAGHTEPSKTSNKKNESDEKKEVETIDLPPAFQRHLRGTKTSAPTQSTPKDSTFPSGQTTPAGLTTSSLSRQPLQGDIAESADTTATEKEVVAPITTQVYDYRTRGRIGTPAFASKTTKNDIREGRWIKSIARDSKRD